MEMPDTFSSALRSGLALERPSARTIAPVTARRSREE